MTVVKWIEYSTSDVYLLQVFNKILHFQIKSPVAIRIVMYLRIAQVVGDLSRHVRHATFTRFWIGITGVSDIVRASGINPRLQTAFKSHAAVDFARSGRALWARESVLAPTDCDLAGVGRRHSMFVDGAQPSAACRAASRVGDHRSAHTPQIAQATRRVRASVFRMAA